MAQDEDRSLKQAIKDGDYTVVDLTVDEIRAFFDKGGNSVALDDLETELDECQGNIYSGNATEQFIVVRIRK